MDERRVVVTGPSERLDRWLRRELPGCSRRLAHALIADGSVRLDGRRTAKGALVHAGMEVTLPRTVALTPNPLLDLAVVYEDADLVAVAKPGGMPSHPLDPRECDTVVNALLARYPETAGLAGGLAHRLDTGTSGLLLAARSLETWTSLRTAFRARAVAKRYLAVVAGTPPLDATIDLPLGHDPGDRRRMVAARPGLRSWPAVSTLHRLASDGRTSLVSIAMRTGVTHQIRVHLAAVGHPVLGDTLYGGPAADLAPGRHALHAAELSLPALGARPALTFHCALPADLARLAPPE
jgi:23S rRNA pseudouridine1911/1915/1917 synthase